MYHSTSPLGLTHTQLQEARAPCLATLSLLTDVTDSPQLQYEPDFAAIQCFWQDTHQYT